MTWTGAEGMEEDVVAPQQFLTGVHIVQTLQVRTVCGMLCYTEL